MAVQRTKAPHLDTRRITQRLVLRTVHGRGPVSRADVARRTGLTRTTVSDVVEDLIAAGLVEEVGPGPSTGGKAPILLRVPADARHLVGIDVDDDEIRGAIVDLAGRVRTREAVTIAGRDGADALVDLEALVDRLVAATDRPVLGIGVGTPGLVDSAAGVVRWAVSLDWHDVPLGERLQQRTGLPVVVVNDSQAAAMAEWTFGRHPGSSGMVVVKVGAGIGAGIVIGGQLYHGEGSGAGEVGHSRVGAESAACHCGSRGCLEVVAGARAALARMEALAAAYPGSRLAQGPLTLEGLAAAVSAGDALAGRVIREVGRPLGRVLGTIVGVLDISDIVLIGPLTALGEPWLTVVAEEARRSCLPLLAGRTTIRFGHVGEDAVELGTAALLMTSQLGLAPAA